MRGLFRRLFGIFMVLTAVSMIAQGASKHAEKIRELTRAVRVGIAVEFVVQLAKGIAELKRNELLAKVDKPEPFCFGDKQFYVTFLNPTLVQEYRNALKLLDIPNSLIDIEKIPILGCKRGMEATMTTMAFSSLCYNLVPYAIIINIDHLKKISSFTRMFSFLHEGGHVKAWSNGVHPGVHGDNELDEVIADTYALATITRRLKEKDLNALVRKLKERLCPHPYLNAQELAYHAEKLRAAQQEGDSVNVIAYAQKIVADRKNKRNVENWKKHLKVYYIPALLAFFAGVGFQRSRI